MSASAPRAFEQTVTFPTPDDFGEPVTYLIVAMNAAGNTTIHGVGTGSQVTFLGAQAINWAITAAIVETLQQRMVQFALGPWPPRNGGHA